MPAYPVPRRALAHPAIVLQAGGGMPRVQCLPLPSAEQVVDDSPRLSESGGDLDTTERGLPLDAPRPDAALRAWSRISTRTSSRIARLASSTSRITPYTHLLKDLLGQWLRGQRLFSITGEEFLNDFSFVVFKPHRYISNPRMGIV